MKSRKNKIISLLLTVSMACSMVIPVHAEEAPSEHAIDGAFSLSLDMAAYEESYGWDSSKYTSETWEGDDGETYERLSQEQGNYLASSHDATVNYLQNTMDGLSGQWVPDSPGNRRGQESSYGTDSSRKITVANVQFGYGSGGVSYTSTAMDIVKVAQSQLGVQESPANSNYTIYADWFYGEHRAEEWCNIFVSWCAAQVKMPDGSGKNLIEGGILNKGAGCTPTFNTLTSGSYGYSSYSITSTKQFGGSSYSPVPGDLMFYSTGDGTSNFGHIGIIETVSETGWTTIEGNTYGNFPDGNDGVARHTISGSTTSVKIREGKIIHVEYPAGGGPIDATGFMWPLSEDYKSLTSGYGERIDPFTKTKRTHNGIDIPAPKGTEIRAAKAGTVKTSAVDKSYGNYVVVEHEDGISTLYAHMSERACVAGETVEQGQVIGYVGSTGRSTGNHLHLEVRINGKRTEPGNYYTSIGLTFGGKPYP